MSVKPESGDSAVALSNSCKHQVTYNWVDITDNFVADCGELELGQLLHDDMFGLFEGMSAIEMMDPKMDAGMMCNQAKRKVLNLQQSIEAGTIKVIDLTHQELVGIFDDTLACFVTWLEGHSLAQTVFINLYLHDPFNSVKDPTLRTFCIGMLKLVDIIRERINRASVYEEEDFQSMTYSFKLAYDLTDTQVTSMLRDAEEELNRTVKMTRVKAGMERDVATEERHALAEAVYTRLKFLRLFLVVMVMAVKEKGQGVEDMKKHAVMMKDLLESIKKSSSLGIQAAVSDNDDSCTMVMGFEPLVNQRLLPPTFPRYTKIKDRRETYACLDALIARVLHTCTVTDLYNLHDLLDFFYDFSQTSPCLLSRSLLQLLLLPTGRGRMFGVHQLQDVVRDTVRAFCAPPALMPRCITLHNNAQVKEFTDAFCAQATQPICYMFQVTGHNRARQRDKWAHQLEDWATLQEEAERLDSFLHSVMLKSDSQWMYRTCFGSWVLYHTLRVMLRYVLSGLELELYSVHEYHYIFWYLSEGLYNWLISTLSRADSFVVEHEALFGEQGKGRGGAGSKKNKNKKQKSHPHQTEMTVNQALHSLCNGYYKAVIGLRMDGKLSSPTYDFDCEEVRYNHRFSAFSCLSTPPIMTYQQFVEMTDVGRYNPPLEPADLYNGAAKSFQQARLYLESISVVSEELQSLLKIAKTNFVVMRVLISGHKKESMTPPEFDFSQHKLFPIIKLS